MNLAQQTHLESLKNRQMKKVNVLGITLLFLCYVSIPTTFYSCDPEDDECDTCNLVYKPNIYIYPGKPMELTLKLKFPMGGEVVKSEPEYGTGWNIHVDTNGLINNSYTYLFYESNQPYVWQTKCGWVIPENELESFFWQNMTDYGFNSREITDFVEYWIPRLKKPFYAIYPQTKTEINPVIQMNFSNQPEHILRLFYVIKGHELMPGKLMEPTIDTFNRQGYFVTEWGVVM